MTLMSQDIQSFSRNFLECTTRRSIQEKDKIRSVKISPEPKNESSQNGHVPKPNRPYFSQQNEHIINYNKQQKCGSKKK